MHQYFIFIFFCSSTLHVSDSLSVHYQESKTVYTASGIRQTNSAGCLLAGTRVPSIVLPFSNTLHMSDDVSVHQQESKTVHTASGICPTGSVAPC
jgi:hypothetical protein